MTIPRQFEFYPYRSIGYGVWLPEVIVRQGYVRSGTEFKRITVKLTDDDEFLQDQNNVAGDPDPGAPQLLTEDVIGVSGEILGKQGTKVHALGQGVIRNHTTGEVGYYMIIGSSGMISETWGISTNILLNPGDYYTLEAVDWNKNNLPYDTLNPSVCFTAGTLIETKTGPVAIEALRAGDMILTYEGVFRPLRWIGSTKIGVNSIIANKKLAPVVISAGALGNNLPKRDLRVSRQHRVLISSPLMQKTAHAKSALIAANKLTEMPGIFVDEQALSVEYFHMLFDRHEIIVSEGAYTESLYLGPEALKSLSEEALEEINMIFPDLIEQAAWQKSDYLIPSPLQQKKIISAHKSTSTSLYTHAH